MSAILNFGDWNWRDVRRGAKAEGGKGRKKWKKERGRRVRGRGRKRKEGVDQHQGTPEEALKTGCSGGTKQVQARS